MYIKIQSNTLVADVTGFTIVLLPSITIPTDLDVADHKVKSKQFNNRSQILLPPRKQPYKSSFSWKPKNDKTIVLLCTQCMFENNDRVFLYEYTKWLDKTEPAE